MMKKLLMIKKNNGSHWVGDGFPVRNIFSYHDIAQEMSPFLMMDYAGPKDFPPTSKRLGVGSHPHRGFETVTIVYEGEVEPNFKLSENIPIPTSGYTNEIKEYSKNVLSFLDFEIDVTPVIIEEDNNRMGDFKEPRNKQQ